MDFTEIYKQTGGLVSFSPGAHFILTAVSDRVIVRRADTFHIARSWLVDALPSATANASTRRQLPEHADLPATAITHIGWSCDSEYVLAACAKAGIVHVFRMRDEDWRTKIEAGAEGLVKAEWAPDGRHVVCFSEWAVSSFFGCVAQRTRMLSLTVRYAAESVSVVSCQWSRVIHPVSSTS